MFWVLLFPNTVIAFTTCLHLQPFKMFSPKLLPTLFLPTETSSTLRKDGETSPILSWYFFFTWNG